MLRLALAVCIAGLSLVGPQSSAVAQDYPNKPVRLIVPYPPGGPTDITGRITAEYLSERLGANVYVDNKPGASSLIGIDLAAKSKPDGYTLVWASSDGFSVLPAIKTSMPYRVPEDFAFVAGIAKSPLLVAVHGKLPFRSMADLIAYAKAHPGKVRYSTSGVGGGGHLGSEAIAKAAGIEMVHIPYPGSVPAVTAAAGGFVEFVLAGAATIKPHTDSGALRVLASLDNERHPQFPDVPTIAEAGFPNLRVVAYFGILAPAGIPDAVLAKIRKSLADIGKDSKVAERFRATGSELAYLDGDAFEKFAIGDLRQWQDVAKSAKIQLND